MMDCNLRQRRDDIPKKNKREKTWYCHDCGVIRFSETRPVCQRVMLAQVQTLDAMAQAEDIELNLDEKTKP